LVGGLRSRGSLSLWKELIVAQRLVYPYVLPLRSLAV
jgi:hypothetical protein